MFCFLLKFTLTMRERVNGACPHRAILGMREWCVPAQGNFECVKGACPHRALFLNVLMR